MTSWNDHGRLPSRVPVPFVGAAVAVLVGFTIAPMVAMVAPDGLPGQSLTTFPGGYLATFVDVGSIPVVFLVPGTIAAALAGFLTGYLTADGSRKGARSAVVAQAVSFVVAVLYFMFPVGWLFSVFGLVAFVPFVFTLPVWVVFGAAGGWYREESGGHRAELVEELRRPQSILVLGCVHLVAVATAQLGSNVSAFMRGNAGVETLPGASFLVLQRAVVLAGLLVIGYWIERRVSPRLGVAN